MAKQSGIHQLKGKVGEMSYYQSTGVSGGLVRRINQGLSDRVKTGEAYANTRLNNAEFGQAGKLASVLAMYITPKFRPMILPFSQSKMAKIILEYIKSNSSAPWGQRNITEGVSGEAFSNALNAVSKNAFDALGLNLSIDEENTLVEAFCTAQTISHLSSIGADTLQFRLVATSTWVGTYQAETGKYAGSYARGLNFDKTLSNVDIDDSALFNYRLRPAPPTGWPAFAAQRMGVLIVMPVRTINGVQNILQEHCTYKAFTLVDGPVD